MINFYVSREELEKAIEQLNIADCQGFTESQAIFRLSIVDKTDQFSKIVHVDDSEFTGQVIMRSHPTDPSKDWGRIDDVSKYKLENGVVSYVAVDK